VGLQWVVSKIGPGERVLSQQADYLFVDGIANGAAVNAAPSIRFRRKEFKNELL